MTNDNTLQLEAVEPPAVPVRPRLTDENAIVVREGRQLNFELTCPVCLVRAPRLLVCTF